MQELFDDLGVRGIAAMEGFGMVAGAVLIVLGRVLLPRERRKKLRFPLVALLIHMGLLLLGKVMPAGLEARRPLFVLALFFLLVSIGRSGFLVSHQLLARNKGWPVPKIFGDIVQVAIYATAVLLTLSAAGVEMGSLLTTSALLTAVIGLSLQDTLGNLFAGLAIQVQRPFEVGDWIQFDETGENIGMVVEINWRACRVLTIEQVEVTVPNNTLGRASIRNFSKPLPESRRSVFCFAPYSVPPRQIEDLVLEAIGDVPGVLTDPKPSVLPYSFGDRGVEYHVRFFVRNFLKRDFIEGLVRERIWYALARANVQIPVPQRRIQLEEAPGADAEADRRSKLEQRARFLRNVDFLSDLPEDALKTLSGMSELRLYDAEEAIIREGEEDEEFYIVRRGSVSVLLSRGKEGEVEVTRLGPGQFFGEMSLMTGERRKATVRAVGECELVTIGKEAFHRIFDDRPELIAHIGEVLSTRARELDRVQADQSKATHRSSNEAKGELLSRIRDFFSI